MASPRSRYAYKRYQRSERWEWKYRGLPFVLDSSGWFYLDTPWEHAKRVRRVPDQHLPTHLELWLVQPHRRRSFYVVFNRGAETWEVHPSWPVFTQEPPR